MKIQTVQIGTVALTPNWRKGVGRGRRRLVDAVPEYRPSPRLSL
jgi:hypothetical protein